MRTFPAAQACIITFTLIVAFIGPARGDIAHVVQRGHTLEAIAHRYNVTVDAVLAASDIDDPKALHPGQELIIPGIDPPTAKSCTGRDPTTKPSSGCNSRGPVVAFEKSPGTRGYRASDILHAVRLGEEFRIRTRDAHGKIPSSALDAFERMMRQGSAMHSVDPRLIARMDIVSRHFDGKTIEVVSGFRPYTSTQYTPHSNHNHGRAIDFRIRGVSNEAVRDFCRTLRGAGCGYYPNSTFVHLDVRDTKAYWVDWSRPGEPPRYDKPGVAADEGAGDVPDEGAGASAKSETDPARRPSLPSGSPEPHPNVAGDSTPN